ncbi:MAG: metal ABC transporter permease [Pigeon pea little leaf phytoplasma]|uniref:Metal ABC transporter permease n=1 Tax=Candidatus Phytoplasma fabacearum TaxID=2982628 RepID=A0ABU8ZTF7_9MOLU|nr:metal ABC transporter permease ['Bituminaria bituminosa' little leaf phytoplasma]MDV3148740.1 metal ABC transporter permease [Pigeon pea little leaf phytoplasma]MDO7983728.1 metal ABC transporter permease ['Bituminaria bituminosa' little leaf phytoplasma]MDO8024063.1 metal ABC transporter permease ['Bituminaria bituminosa' little leaf phytoplasma]MDO8030751.1 metal ABC transporter permease ['Bituminaria bituminosa' little leaf phytoplasma]MDV3154223.1 metal ABC transporter permease [Pigeon 
MNITEFWNYTNIKLLTGTSLLGCASGIIGIIMIFRKQCLLGDTIAHTILPGIVIMYLLTQKTNEWVLWVGAFISSIIAIGLIELIKKYSILPIDAILSLILSSLFGLGNILISIAQKISANNKIAVLEKFILGQIALISYNNIIYITIVTVITGIIIIFLWKEFKIFIFDSTFTRSIGFNIKLINFILNMLLISIIIISLKLMGVILTSSFITLPGIISLQFSNKLHITAILSAIITAIVSLIGIFISYQIPHMPTGPIIIIITDILIIATLLLAPKRSLITKYIKQKKYLKNLKKFKSLINIYLKNKCSEDINLEKFLFQQKYLICINKKIIITSKGKRIIQKLINKEF